MRCQAASIRQRSFPNKLTQPKLCSSTDQGRVTKTYPKLYFKEGCPSKLTDQATWALIREENTRPKMTLEEVKISGVATGSVSVNRTTIIFLCRRLIILFLVVRQQNFHKAVYLTEMRYLLNT